MEWPLKYSDKNGIVKTIIKSDGKRLSTYIREVLFEGDDFDSLKPKDNTDCRMLELFTLSNEMLCNCVLECNINIPIQVEENIVDGDLYFILELGYPKENRALSMEILKITLTYNNESIKSSGMYGWFEDELLDIQKKLPEGTYIKSCINCAYSDYSPYGHGLFGWMMCFRNLKEEYLQVRSKDDFWSIHDNYDRIIQETYLCADFERRKPGTGYRG